LKPSRLPVAGKVIQIFFFDTAILVT